MHLTKTLPFLALGSCALGFVIDAYKDLDCKGETINVNVWDNTCRDTYTIPTRSFRVQEYGAHRQKATLWLWNYCSNSPPPDGPGNAEWWADGGDNAFKKGNCINLDYEANSYGSHSG